MDIYDIFLKAINEKKVVSVTVDTFEKGTIVRKCIPFDYGPSKKFHDAQNRYHFLDLTSPEGPHNLSVLPHQVRDISILNENFDPEHYVKWTPKWFIPRDWGRYS